MRKIKTQVASDVIRDDLFVEVLIDDDLWAEVSELPGGGLRFRIYPHPGSGHWDLEASELEECLRSAKDRWARLGPEQL